MSATIIYDGNEIGNLEGGQTATLNCEGQVMRSNLVIEHNGVESVNGKTGAVTLTADDVGALPSTTTIPSCVGQLVNDVGYARTADHYTKTESDDKYQDKGSYANTDVYDEISRLEEDILSKLNKSTYNTDKANFAKTADHYTKTESDNRYVDSEDFATLEDAVGGKLDKSTYNTDKANFAKTADHYTKTESDNKYQAKGSYIDGSDLDDAVADLEDLIDAKLDKTTYNAGISTFALKSSAETWTFTLADGSTVTKKVVLA